MDDNAKVKNTVIKQNFFNMKYGKTNDNINQAAEWFNKQNTFFAYNGIADEPPNENRTDFENYIEDKHIAFAVYTPESFTIENILASSNSVKWVDVEFKERLRLVTSLAKQIEKKTDLFSQIDIVARGISSKDSKTNIPILVDYLQYYTNYPYVYNINNSSWKPNGLAVMLFSQESPIFLFGIALGPALAAGYNIILQTEARITPAAALLIDLAKDVGIPEGVIRLIPGDVDIQTFFTSNHVSVVSCYDDLFKEKYNVCNPNHCHIINFCSYKIPMLVFEDSDIDSACDTLVKAVWAHHGSLIDQILKALNAKEEVAALCIDLSKAFDSVDHDSLFNKLETL